MGEFVAVAKKDGLKAGECKVVDVNGKGVALYNVDGNFYATDNSCLHHGGPLGEGMLDGTIVTCPWHGWKYNVKTGVSPVNPQAKIETFKVKIEGDEVKVESK
ncbi:Rieske 2Fe-2S domain-containing protein [Candidatus Woesearchaeota archaeon]|nr:Rieske 2Fe-2S domain-containing protein [Candidatus Woesearchaeota archaeon]